MLETVVFSGVTEVCCVLTVLRVMLVGVFSDQSVVFMNGDVIFMVVLEEAGGVV